MLRLFCPLQHGQLQLFHCCKFTSRIYSHRLLLDEEILSCFLPCVNEIRPGPDLQCPVVTIASYSNYVHSFIHSFIPAICIAPLQVFYYSEALPTTACTDTVSELHAEAHRQLQVKDLP